jgi:hypothetical protein
MLQPHRRLALEGDLAREAKECGDRIEQPSGGGRRKGAHARLDQAACLAIAPWKGERRRGHVRDGGELRQEAGGGLYRLARGRVAPRQGCRTHMPDAREPGGDATDEELSAPDRAVVAVAGSVEGDADHAPLECATLGEDARHVRAMVLNGMAPPRRHDGRVRGGPVLGMQIVHDDQPVAIDIVHRHPVTHRLLKRTIGGGVVQIADVLAHERVAADDERDGVLEVRPHGQCRKWDRNPGNRRRRVAAGASENLWTERARPHD